MTNEPGGEDAHPGGGMKTGQCKYKKAGSGREKDGSEIRHHTYRIRIPMGPPRRRGRIDDRITGEGGEGVGARREYDDRDEDRGGELHSKGCGVGGLVWVQWVVLYRASAKRATTYDGIVVYDLESGGREDEGRAGVINERVVGAAAQLSTLAVDTQNRSINHNKKSKTKKSTIW